MLSRADVEKIFYKQKPRLLRNKKLPNSNNPIAILLGGQPACGKGNLVSRVKEDFPDTSFLVINGDLYRAYHPLHLSVIKNSLTYSKETQIFSDVFTEKLIEEAITNRWNFIVEGTMRTPNVPIKTARLLKANGFYVHAYVIAAHPLITELGVYRRYVEEVEKIGYGRLADIDSHNEACIGLLSSLDALYEGKEVESIVIYSYLAKKRIKRIVQKNGEWDLAILPSDIVNKERNQQQYELFVLT